MMTPQERAENVIKQHSGLMHAEGIRQLTELIRVAIVEGNNEEIERRRAVEKRLDWILSGTANAKPPEGSEHAGGKAA